MTFTVVSITFYANELAKWNLFFFLGNFYCHPTMEKCCHVDGNTFCQSLGRSCYHKQPKDEVFEISSNSGKNVDEGYERIAGATGTL